jgi:predicted NUDIX family NTP pyrophosphohydrolase
MPGEMRAPRPTFKAMTRVSAGLLLFRRRGGLEVLLAHPGGPYWQNKDEGAWTVPKGEIEAGEVELAAARREFAEETGYLPQGGVLSLGSARQPGGKLVHVWALADDWDPAQLRSNTFSMEWPPKSGRSQVFPEIDRVGWFALDEARRKILEGQVVFLDRLKAALGP